MYGLFWKAMVTICLKKTRYSLAENEEIKRSEVSYSVQGSFD
jgi:hypothetical protein